jgi:hypothetical protein
MLQAARAPSKVGMHWLIWMDYAEKDQAIRGYLSAENASLVLNDETLVYGGLASRSLPQHLPLSATTGRRTDRGIAKLLIGKTTSLIGHDLSPDAAIREDFEQEGVVLTSINNMRLTHATIQSGQTCLNLRQHALGDHTLLD